MALYVMADLHLSLASDKPMDVFGPRWTGYTEKIKKKWNAVVSDGDTVVIPGDVSWADSELEAEDDFRFISALPGKKIFGKGNHDFWWTTATKIRRFLDRTGNGDSGILFNNAFASDGFIVTGTRGWFFDPGQMSEKNADFDLVVRREKGRLEASLKQGDVLDPEHKYPRIAFFHFPPVFGDFVCEPLVSVLTEAGVRKCYFGHIHGDMFISDFLFYPFYYMFSRSVSPLSSMKSYPRTFSRLDFATTKL